MKKATSTVCAILGNDVAIKAFPEGKRPFPDGTIIARLAWSYVPLEESSKAFGRLQSFVAGPPKNGVQFMVKDSQKNTLRRAAGGSLNLTTANPPTRGCTKHASPATRPSKLAILSFRATHLEGRTKDARGSPRLITADYVKSVVARAAAAPGRRLAAP
jgi:hypothetical protein